MSLNTSKELADLIGLHLIEDVREARAYDNAGTYNNDNDDVDTNDDNNDEPDLVFFVKIDGEEYALFNRGSTLKPEMGVSCQCQGRATWSFYPAALSELDVSPPVEIPPLMCNLFWRPGTNLPLDPTNLPLSLTDLPSVTEPDRVLVAVDEARNLIVFEIGIESYAYQVPSLPLKVAVPIQSGPTVLPGCTVRVRSMSQQCAFRPSRLIIGGNSRLWVVQGIQLADRQLIMGDLPGDVFSPAAYSNNILFPVAQPGQAFDITVRYTGDAALGEPFIAAMFGDTNIHDRSPVTRIGRRYIARWTPEGRFEPWMAAHLPGRDQITGEDLPVHSR